MADIKVIRERGSKATPGPWYSDVTYVVGCVPTGRPGGEVIGEMRPTVTSLDYSLNQRKNNADFIAHARQDIPDLLDVLEEAMKLLDEDLVFVYDGGCRGCVDGEPNEHKETCLVVLRKAFLAKHGAGEGKVKPIRLTSDSKHQNPESQ